MSRVTHDPVLAGRAAADRHAWREAYDLLLAADAADPLGPEDLERLAAAAWWTADLDTCISARERAFAVYRTAGESRRAAIVALALAKDYYAKNAASIGQAWVNRAERLLAGEPDCVELGYLERLRSVMAYEGAGDYEKALELARRTVEIGTRFGDLELQALGVHDEGRARIALGQVDEGMALIDEATVAAVSGELSPYHTGVIYCNTITACKDLADYRRAGDWTEAAKRWCERQAIAGFPGMCRVYRASIMLMRGAWPEAEQEARRACDELAAFNVGYAAEAFYELGEIRMRRGDPASAEEAFRHAHELGRDPQPGLALLRLSEGKLEGACSCIAQALAEESRDLHRARLLPAQVVIALASRDTAKAEGAAGELERISLTFGTDALAAMAATARAQVTRARDDGSAAVAATRKALKLWNAIDAPYEAATARLVLASAHRDLGQVDDAALELEAALAVFERLGADVDARRVREQLKDLTEPGDGRATRTFMFTDIERSTKLVDALGDEPWTALVGWHDRTLRSLFAAHGGEEIDHAGDGFFVAFQDGKAAVECAVAIQRGLAEQRREHGFAPAVRVGLHTAGASRHGAGYKGKGIHEAARISALAGGGEIVASRPTFAGLPIRFTLSEPRTVELQGLDEPIELVAVDWR